ncbi:DUF4139 domain-containing protein [Dysgonomonas sp. 25]|uniref:DUF4139 domain-containing protein n=1 Tax=Dysgonomonas sp. 25 TaxID=2302933 RepID=UPI0013D70626|nr:DUF4139 domain-containing protein [Dysgonomonas sp. 25]NDV68943.1 mucoidy inhibitor MuiA family protein [Dysgonomonas sp. 25]
MKSRLFIYTTLALFSVFSLNAENKPIKATVKEATVFFSGAELTHHATATLTKGENEISIEGLSPNIDRNSLKIKASNGVMVSAYEFSIDYLTESKTNDASIKRMQDSIQYYRDRLQAVEIDIKVNDELSGILKKSTEKNTSGSEKGLSIDELIKTMDYYKKQKTDLDKAANAQKIEQSKLKKSIDRLTRQVEQESTKNNKTSGVLKLNLTASYATNSQLTISYYTASANWSPYYDINITSIDKPIKIATKAKVRQTTGLDWNKVKLSLSTATPSNGKIAPLFSAWFLEERQNNMASLLQGRVPGVAVQNSFSYADKKSVKNEESSVRVRGAGSLSQSSSPLYVVDGEVMDEEDFRDIDQSMIKSIDVLKDASASSIYGARGASGVIVVTTKNSMDDYVSLSDNQLNMEFNIDLPFTVPGNGKEQSLDLNTQDIMAEYKYYCAPKLDTETYLLAEIDNWEKLNLLSGMANITYDGTYVGETNIEANSTQQKLTLTLGSDKRVSVKREKLRDYSSTKFLGNDKEQVFTYKMTVKNNQNKAVKMVLKDQYPISTQKKIEVKLLTKDTTTPTVNKEDLGVITWEETLQPGETKTYQISYSVKYPKEMNLNL